jgi:predicted amidohydrolase
VLGVKARLSENVADANDPEALRRAQEAAAPPVMIHVGQNSSPMPAILAQRKRGDICYGIKFIACERTTSENYLCRCGCPTSAR